MLALELYVAWVSHGGNLESSLEVDGLAARSAEALCMLGNNWQSYGAELSAVAVTMEEVLVERSGRGFVALKTRFTANKNKQRLL